MYTVNFVTIAITFLDAAFKPHWATATSQNQDVTFITFWF